MKEVVWQLIEKHYNVDRGCPQVLIAKEILIGSNPIDQIGEQIADVVEKLVIASLDPKPDQEDEADGTDDDNIPWGYYSGGGD